MIKQLFVKCFLNVILFIIVIPNAFSQVNRLWDFSYSPSGNYWGYGSSITCLPSGRTVTAGYVKDSLSYQGKGILLLTSAAGQLLVLDTSISCNYSKVIYDGRAEIIAAGTLSSDSLHTSKIVVTRIDTNFSSKHFFTPLNLNYSPAYSVEDMAILRNTNIAVASSLFENTYDCLSIICIDSAGNLLWERVDSTSDFNHNVKLLADSSGGLYAAGSGRDRNTLIDFIFIYHINSSGIRDWQYRYDGLTSQFYEVINDFKVDFSGHIYTAGNFINPNQGWVIQGLLIKLDTLGNFIWNRQLSNNHRISKLISDKTGNIYGLEASQYIFSLYRLDSSGTIVGNSAFQNLPGYFHSKDCDLKLLDNGIIAASGSVQDTSIARMDYFIAAFDLSLNILGYDLFDSAGVTGTKNEMTVHDNGVVYSCGAINNGQPNSISNVGIHKYVMHGAVNSILSEEKMEIGFYPNPSSGNITFQSNSNQTQNASLRIVNIAGVEVFREYFKESINQKEYHFKLNPGVYSVIYETASERYISKICIIE